MSVMAWPYDCEPIQTNVQQHHYMWEPIAGREGLEVQEGAVRFELLMHRPQAAACHARLWAFFMAASRACGAAVPPWKHERHDDAPLPCRPPDGYRSMTSQMRISSPYLVVVCIDNHTIHQQTPPPSVAQVSYQSWHSLKCLFNSGFLNIVGSIATHRCLTDAD